MQPPLSAYLRDRIQQLSTQVAVQARVAQRTNIATQQRAEKHARHHTDYVILIRDWQASMPLTMRGRAYTMDEIVRRFQGRYSPSPAPRVIAAALRKLGWTAHRDWTLAGRNTRYWRAPQSVASIRQQP